MHLMCYINPWNPQGQHQWGMLLGSPHRLRQSSRTCPRPVLSLVYTNDLPMNLRVTLSDNPMFHYRPCATKSSRKRSVLCISPTSTCRPSGPNHGCSVHWLQWHPDLEVFFTWTPNESTILISCDPLPPTYSCLPHSLILQQSGSPMVGYLTIMTFSLLTKKDKIIYFYIWQD